MTCRHVSLPGGGYAIVCGLKPKLKRCSCGRPASLLCDWKVGTGKTCDQPICPVCAQSVGEGKDLCMGHQEAYRAWLAGRATVEAST